MLDSEISANSLIRLAPDLTFPSSIALGGGAATGQIAVTGIDTSSGLTEVLGLTGKYSIQFIRLADMLSESTTIKLTVDGVVVWNDTFTLTGAVLTLYGAANGTLAVGSDTPFTCNSSLSLEVNMSTDTDIRIDYLVREIL